MQFNFPISREQPSPSSIIGVCLAPTVGLFQVMPRTLYEFGPSSLKPNEEGRASKHSSRNSSPLSRQLALSDSKSWFRYFWAWLLVPIPWALSRLCWSLVAIPDILKHCRLESAGTPLLSVGTLVLCSASECFLAAECPRPSLLVSNFNLFHLLHQIFSPPCLIFFNMQIIKRKHSHMYSFLLNDRWSIICKWLIHLLQLLFIYFMYRTNPPSVFQQAFSSISFPVWEAPLLICSPELVDCQTQPLKDNRVHLRTTC